MIKGTYVSGDACERAAAYRLNYVCVCHHPREIGVLSSGELLVLDFDHVLFDDRDLAVLKANEAAHRGLLVGIHTYYPEDPRLTRFLALPNVQVAKTHRRVLVLLRKLLRAQRLERDGRATDSNVFPQEATHVRTS